MTYVDMPIDQIIHGNCIHELKKLPDQCVDLIFADPPYNLQLQSELVRPNLTVVDAVNDKWDQFNSFADYDHFTREWLNECRRVLKDNGTIWVIGSYHNIFRVGTVLMDLGYWILNDIHWRKANPMPNFRGTRFTNATETMIWAKKSADQKQYTFHYHAMKHLNDDKQMQNVWEIPICRGQERLRVDGKKAHSTQKPEALLYRVLLSSSNIGDVVLDPFFGSGTTGAVAKKLKRHFIGIEAESAYVELARKRIADIQSPKIADTLLETPSNRGLPRVAFGKLLECEYLSIGQTLYSSNRKHSATIKADGYLITNQFTGSIHQTACHLLNKSSHNGWDFWHYENKKRDLISINDLRVRYRSEVLNIL